MISNRQLGRLNDRIGQELGRNALGEPKYSWRWSEDLVHAMRVPGKFDYATDPETGIVSASPAYETRRMAPHLKDQWVLCRRVEAIPEPEWRLKFGDLLPWPKAGYFFPLNAELEHGTDPDMDSTSCAIDLLRKQFNKTKEELVDEAEKAEDYKRNAKVTELKDRIGSATTAFGNLPGDRGGQVEFQIGRGAVMATDDVFKE